MAGRGDDVLSLQGSDQEGSALSEFSGFEDDDIFSSKVIANYSVEKPSGSKKSDVITPDCTKNKEKNEKGPGKANPKAPSKKGKNKAQKHGQEHVNDKGKKKNTSSI